MHNEKLLRADEICTCLKISIWTLNAWYRYEEKQLKAGLISERYLPKPLRDTSVKGKPRLWTTEMVKELKNYKANIVIGRNGVYGVYSNPKYKNTKKYKDKLEKGE